MKKKSLNQKEKRKRKAEKKKEVQGLQQSDLGPADLPAGTPNSGELREI